MDLPELEALCNDSKDSIAPPSGKKKNYKLQNLKPTFKEAVLIKGTCGNHFLSQTSHFVKGETEALRNRRLSKDQTVESKLEFETPNLQIKAFHTRL